MIVYKVILTNEERRALLRFLSDDNFIKTFSTEQSLKARDPNLYNAYRAILEAQPN